MPTFSACLFPHYASFTSKLNQLGEQLSLNIKKSTRNFLYVLYQRAPVQFNNLINELCSYSLYLDPSHLDIVIEHLEFQQRLPADLPKLLRDCLPHLSALNARLHALTMRYAPDLLTNAKTHQLFHHSLPHALRIEADCRLTLQKLRNEEDQLSLFMHELAIFMIKFHDYEQKNKGDFRSVETATAAMVSTWILDTFRLNDDPEMILFIKLLTERLIVLGTTMVYSLKRTMDLSELFLKIEHIAIAANTLSDTHIDLKLPLALDSTASLLKKINIYMLITGVCDKNPGSIYAVVNHQALHPGYSSLSILKTQLNRPLILEYFLTSSLFSPPFPERASEIEMNQQAFIIPLITHISMRAELVKADKKEGVAVLLQFISECRESHQLVTISDDLVSIMKDLFLSTPFVEKEILFAKSQHGGLRFVSEHLHDIPTENAELINSHACLQDAKNLNELLDFYSRLDNPSQFELIEEILVCLVFQYGQLKALELGLKAIPTLRLFSDEQPLSLPKKQFFSSKKVFPTPSIDDSDCSTVMISLAHSGPNQQHTF